MIDWNRILEGYNRINVTCYPTLYTLMHDLGQQHSANKMDQILGVCRNTIIKKLRELKFKVRNRGWDKRDVSDEVRKLIEMDREKAKYMTESEIASEISCSRQQVWKILGREKIEYKRRRVSLDF